MSRDGAGGGSMASRHLVEKEEKRKRGGGYWRWSSTVLAEQRQQWRCWRVVCDVGATVVMEKKREKLR
ncbi:hypothetical protein HAX54_035588 [Datura stramonium]|uniref:Uncharacterized protein n=1 Tax=Datura stramonium TaxID=4076 RepID=A0ABS8VGS4_DATST|nr:hypothetical protein [Datura stramonium]